MRLVHDSRFSPWEERLWGGSTTTLFLPSTSRSRAMCSSPKERTNQWRSSIHEKKADLFLGPNGSFQSRIYGMPDGTMWIAHKLHASQDALRSILLAFPSQMNQRATPAILSFSVTQQQPRFQEEQSILWSKRERERERPIQSLLSISSWSCSRIPSKKNTKQATSASLDTCRRRWCLGGNVHHRDNTTTTTKADNNSFGHPHNHTESDTTRTRTTRNQLKPPTIQNSRESGRRGVTRTTLDSISSS